MWNLAATYAMFIRLWMSYPVMRASRASCQRAHWTVDTTPTVTNGQSNIGSQSATSLCEDPCLLLLELDLGQHALCLQRTELFELSQPVRRVVLWCLRVLGVAFLVLR